MFYTTGVQLQFNQYRIKKATYTFRLLRAAATVASTTDDQVYPSVPLQFFSAWDRSDVYANTADLAWTKVANYPDCKRSVLDCTHPWVHSTSITAQASGPEAEWLSTDSLPAVAPNTNAFFNPSLYVAGQSGLAPATVAGIDYLIDVTFIVDVRG